MNLRKSLVAAAAIVAAGLMAISGSALAATGSASGTSTGGGTATFLGGTYSCPSGSVSATYNDGTDPNPAFNFSAMSISCSTPVGTATVSLNCAVPVNLTSGRTSSASDTGITGTAVFGTGTCVKVSALFGICQANVQGTVSAAFNEATDRLTLSGPGTLANQTAGCGGALSGTFTLNNIEFAITPTTLNFA